MRNKDNEPLPSFERPPVVETVLGVQFQASHMWRTTHVGVFWKTLSGSWSVQDEVPPVEPVFEAFPANLPWGQLGVRLSASPPQLRVRLVNDARDRMIQIQNGRLHLNWLSGSGGRYPRYEAMADEFASLVESYSAFLEGEGVGPVQPNQWEVTYVNHLPQGSVWSSPGDWSTLFPSIPQVPASAAQDQELESFGGHWRFEIPPKRGRLHVNVEHRCNGEGKDFLRVTLTARGPLPANMDAPLGAGLGCGHEAVVRGFCRLTSDEAHVYWGRTE